MAKAGEDPLAMADDGGAEDAAVDETPAPGTVWPMGRAAASLQKSSASMRKLVAQGVLHATCDAKGRWSFDAAEVMAYKTGRAADHEARILQGVTRAAEYHRQVLAASVREREAYDLVEREDFWDRASTDLRSRIEGYPVTYYLALSKSVDPYYFGSPAQLAGAHWIGYEGDVWPRLGYARLDRPHDRRIHYKILGLGDVVLPDGMPYDLEHREACWTYLQKAILWARYSGDLDLTQIEDHRNPEPLGAGWIEGPPDPPRIRVSRYDEEDLEIVLPDFPSTPSLQVESYAGFQRYQLLVLAEKSTMNDLLEPWCRAHNAWLVTAKGHMTLSGAADLLANRILRDGLRRGVRVRPPRPAAVIFASDFDKAGLSIPEALTRKVQWALDTHYKQRGAPTVFVAPAALSYEQVERFHLPDMPLSAQQRKTKWGPEWERRYGIGFVELDALESVGSGAQAVLADLLDEAARPFYDRDLEQRVEVAGDAARRAARAVEMQNDADAEEEVDMLREEWEDAQQRVQDFAQEVAAPVWARIEAKMGQMAHRLEKEKPNIADYPIPEAPAISDEDAATLLFDSRRTYRQQRPYYKRWQAEHVGAGGGDDDGDDAADGGAAGDDGGDGGEG